MLIKISKSWSLVYTYIKHAREGDRTIVISVSWFALLKKGCDECERPCRRYNTVFKAKSKKL
jgi:hypothetical protein